MLVVSLVMLIGLVTFSIPGKALVMLLYPGFGSGSGSVVLSHGKGG